jgi:hypothetical protein
MKTDDVFDKISYRESRLFSFLFVPIFFFFLTLTPHCHHKNKHTNNNPFDQIDDDDDVHRFTFFSLLHNNNIVSKS